MSLPSFDPKQQMLQCFLSATIAPDNVTRYTSALFSFVVVTFLGYRLESRLQILCHNPLQAASPFDYVEHIYQADRASKNLRAVRVRLEEHTNGVWDLVYVGQASHRGEDITSQRGVCRIALQENGHPLCQALGMTKQAAIRRVGQAYTSDDIVLTTVTQLFRVNDDGTEMLISPDYYVEVSATGPSTTKPKLAEAVLQFAGALHPVVRLQRLDPVVQ
eukprot:m.217294 g.217294  ORF g.217294 m.217294 type:complete len:218 (-) comp17203_c0_seq35:3174-3827(-)